MMDSHGIHRYTTEHPGQDGGIEAISWSPEGLLVCSVGEYIYHLKGGRPNTKWEATGLSWTPDGKVLASAAACNLQLWDAYGNLVHSMDMDALESSSFGFSAPQVSSVAWSPDGQLLASGWNDRSIRLLDPNLVVTRVLSGHSHVPWHLEWISGSRMLASQTRNGGEAILWDIDRGEIIADAAGVPGQTGLGVFFLPEDVPQSFGEDISLNPIEIPDMFKHHSCFISYSTKDHEFAERLHADLRDKGIACWFAPEDLKIGDRHQEVIEESIRRFDKMIIVLSETSINSRWVEREVNAAMEREDAGKQSVLFPIRIDETVMQAKQPWAAEIRRLRHIGDFRDWRNAPSYLKAFERLLRDLKA
jgi:hypothetical protein